LSDLPDGIVIDIGGDCIKRVMRVLAATGSVYVCGAGADVGTVLPSNIWKSSCMKVKISLDVVVFACMECVGAKAEWRGCRAGFVVTAGSVFLQQVPYSHGYVRSCTCL
jgi:hypothetical protein